MASGIAHELNQPLSGIRVYADTVQSLLESGKNPPSEAIRQTMDKVIGLVDRAASIIEHMREFSSDRRAQDRQPETVLLAQCAERSLELIGHQLAARGIKVSNLIPSDLVVMANAHRLEQVLINLFSNSRDAITESGASAGTITLTASACSDPCDERCADLYIADSGPGIPAELHERIFEPFFTTKDPGLGTGLGLAICHGILKDYDATISITQSSPAGTTFKICFRCPKEPSP